MRLSIRGLVGLALGVGAAFLSLVPYVSLWEEKIGLGVLFALRGERQAPSDVVIVSIDKQSAEMLALPENPEDMPRRLHAELIRRLREAGAASVGFDIFFSASHPEDDTELAAAIREADSVVLASFLRLRRLKADAFVESLDEPPEVLARSAGATAPFLLAQNEEAERLLIRYGENGDQPTFPLLLFRRVVEKKIAGDLENLVRDVDSIRLAGTNSASGHAELLRQLENLFESRPELKERLIRRVLEQPLSDDKRNCLLSLLETLSGEKTHFFNHYGAAGAISRIPYHQVLVPPPEAPKLDLRGKAVLVGFAADFQPGASENLYLSPFSPVDSVELAATGLANLLAHDDVRPLLSGWGQFAWLLFWGWLLCFMSSKRLIMGLWGIVLASLGYLAVASFLFGEHALWLPVILPLFWMAPVGMIACLAVNYVKRKQEHLRIQSVVTRYIPDQAANSAEYGGNEGPWESKLSFGVCLATDAGQYSTLAEQVKPMDLGDLMNDYYTALFGIVRRNGGWVSDVIGDAMMAVWTRSANREDMRVQALRAALEMLGEVDSFQARRRVSLPIRMGLHCGEMRVGFVGGKEHAAYRAVGDTVNTSARLEGLNKLLGTRILVSRSVIEGLQGFVTRAVGNFRLPGKCQPVAVHELVASVEGCTPELMAMVGRFEQALALFHSAHWREARLSFERLTGEFPMDGPTRFYANAARANAENPSPNPDLAIIPVSKPPPGVLANR